MIMKNETTVIFTHYICSAHKLKSKHDSMVQYVLWVSTDYVWDAYDHIFLSDGMNQ